MPRFSSILASPSTPSARAVSAARRFALLAPLLGCLAATGACRPSPYVPDPTDGAVHIPRLGQTEPYSKLRDETAKVDEEASTLQVEGRFAADVRALHRVALHKWANRSVHETRDAIDVDAVLMELGKKSETSRDDDAFAHAVRTALCKLGDGNFRLEEVPSRGQWLRSGVTVHWLSGDAVVTSVDEDRFSRARRPKVGDVVVEVDGKLLAEYLQQACIVPGSTPAQRTQRLLKTLGTQYRVDDERELPQKLTLRRSNDRRYDVELDWQELSQTALDEERPCLEARTLLEGKLGILTVRSFSCDRGKGDSDEQFERKLTAALAEVATVEDLVIDLRDTEGGSLENARRLAAILVAEPIEWTRSRQRSTGKSWPPFSSTTVEPASGPGDVEALRNTPLWLLVGPGCASSCELFAAAMSVRRGTTTVGLPTAGSVGDPQPVSLETSGLVISVPRTQYAVPGTDALIEGRGVEPLVEVATTVTDVRRGRDPVLEAVFQRK